jgi:hypothetical protein
MRPRLVHLICASVALLAATSPAPAQMSDKVRAALRESLPKYTPRAAEPKPVESSIGTPAPLDDEPVVRLPDFWVVDRASPTNDPDKWLGKQGLQKKALREYKDSMNALDWALNSWYIPLPFGFSLTPSPQARADAAYQEKKMANEIRSWSTVIDAVSRMDPAAAEKLARDADLSRHPGG